MSIGTKPKSDHPASCTLLDSYSSGNSATDSSDDIQLNDEDYGDEEDYGEHVTITINLPQAEMHGWGE